jgi:L-ascorbate metabolism protein UlaG (beta-lactamase superfamily)
MKITWLGHASFRIETGSTVILLDPWLGGNPSFPDERREEAIRGATHVLLTHGHFDHFSEAKDIARECGAPLVGIFDLIGWVTGDGSVEGIGFNKGGTVTLGDAAVTMVNAVHSSSTSGPDGTPVYAGAEAGYMIEAEGKTLYVMGDTDAMADMGVLAELHAPRYAIVPIGGHFTMDSARAAWACRKWFSFEAVIPSHYASFPLLEQSAEGFAKAMAPTRVEVPKVMESVTL